MTINTQSAAAIARQAIAILGIVFGVLTQSVTTLHLPVAISTVLTIAGAVILGIEHYVGDPSTGPQPPVVVTTHPTTVTPVPVPSMEPSLP